MTVFTTNSCVQSFARFGLLAICTIGYALPAYAGLAANAGVHDGSAASVVSRIGDPANNYQVAVDMASGDAHATASAAYGVLKVSNSGSTSMGGSNGGAQASYTDTLWLENAALTGQSGRITMAYYFDYSAFVNATGNGFSNGSVSVQAWANSNYSWFLDYLNSDGRGYTMFEHSEPSGQGRTYNVPQTNYLYVTTDFTWGNAINTRFALETSVGSYVPNTGGGTASYSFDASHSGYWAGIVSATANGQQVSDYTLSSLSGTDYSHSFAPSNDVPEPATAAIFLAGLALLGIQRARKN